MSTWPWTIWAEEPGRVGRADDREGLRGAPVLGAGFRPRQVRRDRRYQQLRSRTRPSPEGPRDRGAGGGAPEAPAAKLAPYPREVRPFGCRARSTGGE